MSVLGLILSSYPYMRSGTVSLVIFGQLPDASRSDRGQVEGDVMCSYLFSSCPFHPILIFVDFLPEGFKEEIDGISRSSNN